MMRSMKIVDGAGLGCLARGGETRPLAGERARERAGERAGEADRLGRGLRARERERRGRDLDRARPLEEPARFRGDSLPDERRGITAVESKEERKKVVHDEKNGKNIFFENEFVEQQTRPRVEN